MGTLGESWIKNPRADSVRRARARPLRKDSMPQPLRTVERPMPTRAPIAETEFGTVAFADELSTSWPVTDLRQPSCPDQLSFGSLQIVADCREPCQQWQCQSERSVERL